MGLFDIFTSQFIDIIDWLDESNDTLVYRFDRQDNAIKNGAKLTVREGQMAVFVSQGQTADVFGPGMYELVTANLPILTDLNHWDHGFSSPFKAEVYFFNMRRFGDLKWGTRNPIMLNDPEFGPLRLRAFGTYEMRIGEPQTLLVQVVGTDGHFTMDEISDRLRNIIVSKFSSSLARAKIPALELAANYQQLGELVATQLDEEFADYGIKLEEFWVENISFPPRVEEALDQRSSVEMVGDLSRYFRFQQAEALGAAASADNAMGAGMGAGMGAALGASLAAGMQAAPVAPQPAPEPEPRPEPVPASPAAPSGLPADLEYHLGIDGEIQGPFNAEAMVDLVQAGRINGQTLAWTAGMEGWEPMEAVAELAGILDHMPPPMPAPLPGPGAS
jgi:membrane protease subunit (stomatin/prohibitin family)